MIIVIIYIMHYNHEKSPSKTHVTSWVIPAVDKTISKCAF